MSTTIANFGKGAVAAEHSRPACRLSDPTLRLHRCPDSRGLDKFFHLLCNWDQYLAPWAARLSPIGGHNFMLVVGVVEVLAGLLVAVKPR